MQICLITEKMYPDENADISASYDWIRSFSHDEFKCLVIGDSPKNRCNFTSDVPKNLIEFAEISLDKPEPSIFKSFTRKFLKNKEEREVLELHFSGKKSRWPMLFKLVRSMGSAKIYSFFYSKEFFDIVKKIYLSGYTEESFLEFVSYIRSMYFSQFIVMNAKIPKADLYHGMCAGYAGLLGSLASYLYDKPFVLSERDLYALEKEAEILKNAGMKTYARKLWIQYYRNMTQCAYAHARTVVSQNEKKRKRQLHLGCVASRCMVVPEGIEIEGDYQKQAWDQKNFDKMVLGTIGSRLSQRDIITLLEGYSLAKTEEHRLQLYLLEGSDASYVKYCKDYIENQQIPDVVFTDALDLSSYLHQVDVMIFLPNDENIPTSLLLAMASGIPVITTDLEGGEALIEPKNDRLGPAGIRIPILDKQKLAEAILYLAQHRKVAYYMGRAGASRIRHHYTKASVIQEYKLIYAIAQGRYHRGHSLPIEYIHG